jgi:hypothetical protein
MLIRIPALLICWIGLAQIGWADPLFTTDDPGPLEYRHWEVYSLP